MTPQRIKEAAVKYTKDEGYQKAYIAGATAEYHRTIDEVDKAIHAERNKMQAKFSEVDKQYAALLKGQRDKAQGLVDALVTETEKVHKMYHEQYGDNRAANHLINTIRDIVAKWKGEGPERSVSIGEHITYCQDCGFPILPINECNCDDV